MRKHNQLHTLGAMHYKVHLRLLRKLKYFKCALWSENVVVYISDKIDLVFLDH